MSSLGLHAVSSGQRREESTKEVLRNAYLRNQVLQYSAATSISNVGKHKSAAKRNLQNRTLLLMRSRDDIEHDVITHLLCLGP